MAQTSSLYNEFKSLVDNSTTEAPLQKFLEEHLEILIRTFSQGALYPFVSPKFHLADEFIPDFVIVGHRSAWSWDVDLIEIEPAAFNNQALFNKTGQSTGRLRIAETQIRNWQDWMRKNKDAIFVPRALDKLKSAGAWDERPEFYKPSDGTHQDLMVWYRIIIGRRKDFQRSGINYQSSYWANSNYRVEIATWDRLLEKAHHLFREDSI